MSRARAASAAPWSPLLATGSWSNEGPVAAGVWLSKRTIQPPSLMRWHVEIALDVIDAPAPPQFDELTATRFHLDVYSEEWGVFFCHRGQSSWIRFTDIAFVHGRDDFALLGVTPALEDIGALLRRLEKRYSVKLRRDHALIRSNLPTAEPAVRRWLLGL